MENYIANPKPPICFHAVAQPLIDNLHAQGHRAHLALKRAERFIRGFEDDELQEGIPVLLAEVRAAITGETPPKP